MRLLVLTRRAPESAGPRFGQRARGFTSVFDAATANVWDMNDDEYRKFLDWKKPKDDAIKEALTLLSAAGSTKDKPLKFLLAGNGGPDNQQAFTPLMQTAIQTQQPGCGRSRH